MGQPPVALRAFPLLSAIAGKGDAASAAGRPLRGGRWHGPRQFQAAKYSPDPQDKRKALYL